MAYTCGWGSLPVLEPCWVRDPPRNVMTSVLLVFVYRPFLLIAYNFVLRRIVFNCIWGMFEFAKSRAMRSIRASVVYVPTCQKHANFSFLRAKSMPIFQLGVPTRQKACQFFNFACQTVCQFFNYFSKEFCFFIYLINLYLIYFLYFQYIPNICYLCEYIFSNLTLSSCVKSLFRKTYIMHTINLGGKAYIM